MLVPLGLTLPLSVAAVLLIAVAANVVAMGAWSGAIDRFIDDVRRAWGEQNISIIRGCDDVIARRWLRDPASLCLARSR